MRSGEDLKRHFNMQVQSHFEMEFNNGKIYEGQRQCDKRVLATKRTPTPRLTRI